MNNARYDSMQNFLDLIKKFAISNPNRDIDDKFIYSNLIKYNINASQMGEAKINQHFPIITNYFKGNNKVNYCMSQNGYYLVLKNGNLNGNEIKLYVPLDYNHILNGAVIITDYMAKNGIEFQAKLAKVIRNDDFIIQVNTIKDANEIIKFIYNNDYIKEGLLRENPFLPSINGVGLTMDNDYSFNRILSESLSDYIRQLKNQNRVESGNVREFNAFLANLAHNEQNLDKKDIYNLLTKTTDANFSANMLSNFIKDKIVDKYDNLNQRITEPEYYLDRALIVTNQTYPNTVKGALIKYISGDPSYIADDGYARQGLLKYVKSEDVVNLMRQKLKQVNYTGSNDIGNLIDKYLSLVIVTRHEKSVYELFHMLQNAYLNTQEVYDTLQANYALRRLIDENNSMGFTNRYNDRDILNRYVLGKNIKNIILTGISYDRTIDYNNTNAFVSLFAEYLNGRKF